MNHITLLISRFCSFEALSNLGIHLLNTIFRVIKSIAPESTILTSEPVIRFPIKPLGNLHNPSLGRYSCPRGIFIPQHNGGTYWLSAWRPHQTGRASGFRHLCNWSNRAVVVTLSLQLEVSPSRGRLRPNSPRKLCKNLHMPEVAKR